MRGGLWAPSSLSVLRAARPTPGRAAPAALRAGAGAARDMPFSAFEYEVLGKVQGVFFRAHTAEQAKKLGVVGYVKNTPAGTVSGEVQGAGPQVEKMKEYLKKEGSPASRIDECRISNEQHDLESLAYSEFEVRK